MKIKSKKMLFMGIIFLSVFVIWTFLVRLIDVKNIGPNESSIGFAMLNGFLHSLIGVNFTLYTITDWLGLVPIAVAFCFAILGLVQLIKRKSILKVDYSILALGIFYIFVIAVYIIFEIVVINYRPTLINGYLEASYPSSTTMLTACVMPTAAIQLYERIQRKSFRRFVIILIIAFTAFMIIGRIISGVHWISDIIGGALFSAGAVLIYGSLHNI